MNQNPKVTDPNLERFATALIQADEHLSSLRKTIAPIEHELDVKHPLRACLSNLRANLNGFNLTKEAVKLIQGNVQIEAPEPAPAPKAEKKQDAKPVLVPNRLNEQDRSILNLLSERDPDFLTREFIATSLGIKRQQVNETLKKLISKGLVQGENEVKIVA